MNEINDTYKTIALTAQGLYKEKNSKFIAFAFPVKKEEDIKEILESLKKKYHDANHHCYAYRIGEQQNSFRFNDDGEPSGTAGKPIYGQILSKDLTNVLIVVVRYFGGTKLGVSGLLNAYKQAALNAITQATIVAKTVNETFEVGFQYEDMNRIMSLLKKMHATIISQNHDDQCTIQFSIRKRDATMLINTLNTSKTIKIKAIK